MSSKLEQIFCVSMLTRISTGVSQSSLSKSYMGKAGSDAGADRACVLSLTADSPKHTGREWPALRVQWDLSLRGLVDSTNGDIFSSKAFLAQRNEPRLGSILKRY